MSPHSAAPRLVHVTTVDLSLRFLLREQLRAFRAAGFDVVGISAPGPWAADLAADGVAHIAVPALQRRWTPPADMWAVLDLTLMLRRLRPAIVHTHTPKAGVLGRIAGRLAGVPIVVNTVHGLYTGNGSRQRRALLLLLERLAARMSDFEFCQSREDLEALRSLRILDPARSAYLGNGVPLGVFNPSSVDRDAARRDLGLPADAVVVGTVGRLVWEKGYHEVFAMAEALRQRYPRVVVLAVGPPEPGKADAVPRALIDDLSRRQVVRFLGLRTDMPWIYAAMDIFVLASHREGFPRSAIEAAAMTRPLILSDIRGCREVIANGRGGFLVPVGDVAGLVRCVSRLVEDPALRARFGAENRGRARAEFDEERVIGMTLDLYRRLLWEKQGVRIGTGQESRA